MQRKIGDWVADDQTDTLQRGEIVRKVERRAMAVLCHLAERPGDVVSKDDLIEAVWGDVAVSDHSVAIVISQLRRAFEDDRSSPAYIQTIPKRGCRLIAKVSADCSELATPKTGVAASKQPRLRVNPWLATALVVLVALFAAAPLAMQGRQEAPAIAVADFVNETGSADRDHVAFALAELVSSRLVENSGAKVLRWRSTTGGRPDENDVVLLTGRLARDGDQELVFVQLTRPATGEVLRGHNYALGDASFVAAAAEIARDAAGVIGRPATIAAGEDQPAEAYSLYWRARFAASVREHDALRRASDLLVTLVRDYPDFAAGHAALADIYAHKTGEHLGLPRLDTFAEAERHLAEARRLAGETSETAVTAATLSFYRDRDFAEALKQARKATALNSGNALAWQTRGMIASASGQDRDALDSIERARALDPSTPSILWDRVWFLYIAGRYAEGIAAADEAARISAPVDLYLALLYDAAGRGDDAFAAWVRRAAARGIDVTGLSATGANYPALLKVMAADPANTDHGVPLALLRLKAGDKAGAAEAVLQSPPARDSWMMLWARRIEALAPLSADPRVDRLLANPRELPAE